MGWAVLGVFVWFLVFLFHFGKNTWKNYREVLQKGRNQLFLERPLLVRAFPSAKTKQSLATFLRWNITYETTWLVGFNPFRKYSTGFDFILKKEMKLVKSSYESPRKLRCNKLNLEYPGQFNTNYFLLGQGEPIITSCFSWRGQPGYGLVGRWHKSRKQPPRYRWRPDCSVEPCWIWRLPSKSVFSFKATWQGRAGWPE